ncbi:MAG: porin [Myxococcota bacterium]
MAPRPVLGEQVYYQPGKGLVAESADGDFALKLRVRTQLLYTWVHDGPSGNDAQSFQLRRSRVVFEGNLFGEHNEYKVELAVAPRDMSADPDVGPTLTPILDTYFNFTHLRDLQVRVGQYKVPFSRERVISSGDLEFVDRSITNAEFTVDRDIGLELFSDDLLGLDKLRYHAGVYMGAGRDAFQLDDFDMMYLARLEYLPFGMFADYKQGDFERLLAPRLSIGAGYAYLDAATGTRGILGDPPADGGTTDYHVATADAVFMYGGLSVTGRGFYRKGERNVPAGETPDPAFARNGFGLSGQVAYLIPRLPLQLGVRYSGIRGTGDTSLPDQNELGAAVGWYFAHHVFKIQADYFHLWNEELDQGEDRVRVQLQASI